MPESIRTAFYNYVTRIAQASVRRELRACNDRFLADTGFSRELLEQGVSAWPWRIVDADAKERSAI